jgi:hypothetical protein
MYTLTTTLLGPVDATPEEIRAAFLKNGRPKVSEAALAAFCQAVVAVSRLTGIRTKVLAGQSAHETNWLQFTGDVLPAQNNYAGLGTTGGGVRGHSFATPLDGMIAQGVHHLGYILGDPANWPEDLRKYRGADPRLDKVLSSGSAGLVKRIGDYTNGRWAYSSDKPVGTLENGYARAIVAAANAIQEIPVSTTQPTPNLPKLLPPRWVDRRKDCSRFDGYAHPMEPRMIFHHITSPPAGSIAPGRPAPSREYLIGPGQGGPSASFHLDRDGVLTYIVDLTHSPWTQGINFTDPTAPSYFPRGINPRTGKPVYDTAHPIIAAAMQANRSPNTIGWSIEIEGYDADDITAAQWAVLPALDAWLCQQGGFSPRAQVTLVGHYQVDNVNKLNCPGFTPENWARLERAVAALYQGPAAPNNAITGLEQALAAGLSIPEGIYRISGGVA